MTQFNRVQQALDILRKQEGSGIRPNSSIVYQDLSKLSGVVSVENIAESIKVEANQNIEVFDENIRKLVNKFYDFSAVYREGHIERFVDDVKNLDVLLNKSTVEFVDKIRWSDNEDEVEQLRKPVSFAYLNLFGSNDGLKVVTPEDFWHCTDFEQLRKDLYRTTHFKNIGTIFVLKNSYDVVNRLLALMTELRLACVKWSTECETVLNSCIDTLVRGGTIPLTDKIDFHASSATVLGTVMTPDIPIAINNKWYTKRLATTIGSMVDDTHLLLADPYALCTPNNTDSPEELANLFGYVKNEEVVENLKLLQREFVNVVEQVDLSSRRLTKVIERLREIPERANDGTYNYALQDISVLLSIYSGTLSEVATFTVNTAVAVEDTFVEVNTLVSKVNTLRVTVDDYIAKRLKK